MPRKRKGADLSRSTSKARNLRNNRSESTKEQIQQQNTDARVRMAQLHQEEPEDTRAERNEVRRLKQRQSPRFTVKRRRTNDQQRQQVHRAFISDSLPRLAFQLAFAMTINKSQGQTMSVCGLDLRTPCFSHGQLYVVCSRVGKPL
ncbi:uncharacterized protein LOC132953741 [Metopolophium dirhodum]|uniref:uncharacterized protein LOC132953741 n=1 Tax=Metopolophium dirhodum TaxID=44670 RepID=UPI0029906873|nr:uncharacterized protein LOC132953741 [Metopolophium dirhodum]